MNYSKQIFDMLGVEPNEEFKLEPMMGDNVYYLSTDLSLHNNIGKLSALSIWHILSGTYQIIKLPKIITPTKEEQIAIEYARACGCYWIAKDRSGDINAFEASPCRLLDYWCPPKTQGGKIVKIDMPISFISWQDQEPYYIGNEGVAQETSRYPDSFF